MHRPQAALRHFETFLTIADNVALRTQSRCPANGTRSAFQISGPAPESVLWRIAKEGQGERDPQDRGDPGRRRGRLQPARRGGRGPHAGAAAGAAQRSDRPDDCRASWARGQAHRRRGAGRVPQRRRRGALRDRGAARHARTQCRRACGSPHRVPGRHPPRRRGRGERRRPDGRRRQHRRAARRRLRGRRGLHLGGCLPTGARQDEGSLRRSRRADAEEHRTADARLPRAAG